MISYILNPSSIAIFGVSHDPEKVGHAILKNIIQYKFSGEVYPINPKGGTILDRKVFRDLSEIDGSIDLAIIVTPARTVPDILLKCSIKGISSAIIISAGFRETGPEGIKLEEEIKSISKNKSIRILGPNCLGIINTSINLNASFASGMPPKGGLSFFSQSGALGVAILDWAIENNIGFSKFISLGNKVDLNATDFIEYSMDDTETDVILGYIEDIKEGKRFLNVSKKATKKKPILLIKSGGTQAGARAASSHTGALAGMEAAYQSAFIQSGVLRANGVNDLFEKAKGFTQKRLPTKNRLLIITNAGGPGIIAADTAEKNGIDLPLMSKEATIRISKKLPKNASLYNPVDIIGDANSERYKSVLDEAIKDPMVDGIVVILTPQAMTDVDNVAHVIVDIFKSTHKPIITCFMGGERIKNGVEILKGNSIPNYSYPEEAVTSFKCLVDYHSWKTLKEGTFIEIKGEKTTVSKLIKESIKEEGFKLFEDKSRIILEAYGFTFPEKVLVQTSEDAAKIGRQIGFPVVMKVSSPEILHKTDVGGVKIGISSEKEAREAFYEITSNVKNFIPDAFIQGVNIYEMIKGSKEIIIGVSFDRTFGHMIMFGIGGIYVEVLKDVSFRILPIPEEDAEKMIKEIKTYPLLKGVRGEESVDIGKIAESLLKVSQLITDFPEIVELDINPLIVNTKRAVALDARIVLESNQ